MERRKITCSSEVQAVASTKAIWTIKGWDGPLSNVARSQAACYMSVGDVDLRFHLRYSEDLDEDEDVRTYLLNSGCGVFDRPMKCSGYSLLVDVLSEQSEQLVFSVDVHDLPLLQGRGYTSRKNVIVVDATSPKRDITAIQMLHRTRLSYDFPEGILTRDVYDERFDPPSLVQPDKQYSLIVTSYKSSNTGTDDQIGKMKSETTDSAASGLVQDMKNLRMDPDNFSDVVLLSSDGMEIPAHRFILAARSEYFRHLFKNCENSTPIFTRVEAKPLNLLVHWMYSEEISPDSLPYLEKMCKAAIMLEIPDFLDDLDKKMLTLCNPESMLSLENLAQKYKLNKSAAKLEQYIERHVQNSFAGRPEASIEKAASELPTAVSPDSFPTEELVPQGPTHRSPSFHKPNKPLGYTQYPYYEPQQFDNGQYTRWNPNGYPTFQSGYSAFPRTRSGTYKQSPGFMTTPVISASGTLQPNHWQRKPTHCSENSNVSGTRC